MTKSIHGHEVMKLMIELNGDFTRQSLKTAINDRFGHSAQFHTCSAENMTADELITFLDERGKFLKSESGFTTDPSKICDHE